MKSGELTPQEKAFVDYVFSEKGMEAVNKSGYIPVKQLDNFLGLSYQPFFKIR